MLDAALNTGREIHFIHAARNGQVHAFRDHIDSLAGQHGHLRRFYCYAEVGDDETHVHASGYLNNELLDKWLPASRDVDAYFLGPLPFMQTVKRSLVELGVPEEQTHCEFFGPAIALQ